jgi:hypothetical protein
MAKKKKNKGKGKAPTIHNTMGGIIKDEIKNSIRSGLKKNFGVVGRLMAGRMGKSDNPTMKSGIAPMGATVLKGKTLESALKEHSKITVGLMGSISGTTARGFGDIDDAIQSGKDRIGASSPN